MNTLVPTLPRQSRAAVARPLGEVDEDAVFDLADQIEQEEGVPIEVAFRFAVMRLSPTHGEGGAA